MASFEKDNKYYISDSIEVMYGRSEAHGVCPEHLHDFIEIVYIIKGKSVHIIDGIEYPVRHGDLLIINYNQTHSFDKHPDTHYINVLIKPEYVNRSLANEENVFALLNLSEFEEFKKILDSKKRKVTFVGEERDRIEDIIKLLNSEIENKEAGYNLAVRSNLNLLLIMIFRKMSISFETTFGGISEKLLDYIKRHCSEQITLEDAAKRCLYNPSYFSRIFKQYTHMTFTQYLRKVRIQKAADIIKNTDMKITDVIYEVGYSDKTKFYSHFRAQMGVTPLQYRKSKK